ncbi:chemotaxis protein CheW [Virgibacillus halophilus]|uniref:Chemotaxis protein CheW n=1 Tax=Tigheibacillus halophilus TaxID=361280 RepID=A0ABU5CAP1_9BACI|nr:chemotaxis protein CheW [Virgibacillus halophilus]
MITESNKTRKVIVFQVEHEEFAVSVEHVGGIERMMHITRVPQTAFFVKGVINLRGVVTPIIDLRSRFGMEAIEYDNETRIIIVAEGDKEVGLIVDRANDVIDIPEDAVEAAPDVIGSVKIDYIEGVVKIDDRLLILLDLKQVLSAEKIHGNDVKGL